jgi:hypothetical protein
MINKEILTKKLNEIIDSVNDLDDMDGFDLINEKGGFAFAIRCIAIADNFVVTFGGYDVHFEIYNVEHTSVDELVDAFYKYITNYEAENLENYNFVKPEVL